jgi:hypothetical protein
MATIKATISRFKKNVSAGLCGACGEREPIEGETLCDPCKELREEADIRFRKAKIDNGQCRRCSEKAEDGRVLCRKHTQWDRARDRPKMTREEIAKKLFSLHRQMERLAQGMATAFPDKSTEMMGASSMALEWHDNIRAEMPKNTEEL